MIQALGVFRGGAGEHTAGTLHGARAGSISPYTRSARLQDAKHPLLVIGAGANRKVTSNMLRRLVENTGLPFCDTQMGKGVIDSSAPHQAQRRVARPGDA